MTVRNIRCAAGTFVFVCFLAIADGQSAQAQVRDFNVPAQSATTGIPEFARQAGIQILVSEPLVHGKNIAAVSGSHSVQEGLAILLKGTGLMAFSKDGATYTVAPAPPATTKISPPYHTVPESSQNMSATDVNPPAKEGLSEIIVTGTHIRGEAPVGSALTVYSRQELDRSGAATLEQFGRQMVENFSSSDSIANNQSNIQYARFAGAATNEFAGASFDLHGVGPSATLTLLNGHRLAPAGNDGSFTDISQIPLSAIDHIEVLADGASAIYGADAVAGVVNIITRKDFEGATTSLRYGGATDGGAGEFTGSQLFGSAWESGNMLVNYEYDRQGGLNSTQRDYIPDQGGPSTLIPKNTRNSVFVSVEQELTPRLSLSGELLYSGRRFSSENFSNGIAQSTDGSNSGRNNQGGAVLGIDAALFGDWHASLTGNYSKIRQSDDGVSNFSSPTFSLTSLGSTQTNTDLVGVDALLSGSLFSLPAGPVKAAVGTGWRRERFDDTTVRQAPALDLVSVLALPTLQRHVTSVYTELLVPIVGKANAVPLAHRLELSLALRCDDYSDFGSSTNPKLGLAWEPFDGIDFRGTYGRSFKAPLLSQLGSPVSASTNTLPDATSPSGSADTIFVSGGNPNLGPETSKSYTVGLDLKPLQLPHFKLSADYFHIEYSNRISAPPIVSFDILDDPTLAPFVQRNPPLALVQSYFNSPGFIDSTGGGVSGVTAIFNSQYANISTTKQSGIDLKMSYDWPTSFGRITFSSAIDHLLKDEFQVSSATAPFALLNTFGGPAAWKARSSLAWNQGRMSASIVANYTNSYNNTLFTPPRGIDSWTTGDLYLSYRVGVDETYLLRGVTIALSVQNIANSRPPNADIPLTPSGVVGIPFDPTNASPVGRLVAVSISKNW